MTATRSTAMLAAIAATLAFAGRRHRAAGLPAKPIKIIVPFPPGGSADLVARVVGQKLSENTKQPVIVENRPGADTIIAMESGRKSPRRTAIPWDTRSGPPSP